MDTKRASVALLLWAGLLAGPSLPAQDLLEKVGREASERPAVQQPTLKAAGAASRSVQVDCVREANRRGFAVLDTTNFRRFREGWSVDLRVRDARGREHRGACFVESGSGDVALYGLGWGYADRGDERMQFSCASIDNRYRECSLPVDGRVRLVERLSKSRCVEGQSWGQRGDRVWVDHGCRARFEVTRGQQREPPGRGRGVPGGPHLVEDACVAEAERRGYRIVQAGRPTLGRDGYHMTLRVRMPRGEIRGLGCHYDRDTRVPRLDWQDY